MSGRSWGFDWITSAAVCCLTALLLVLQVVDPPLIEAARLKLFDLYAQAKPRATPDPSPVLIVDVDERSLQEIGQWPWPRTVLADLIDRLGEMGAKTIAFDVIFAEPDRFSPSEFAATLREGDPMVAALLRNWPNNDAVMAEAMTRYSVVLGQPASPNSLPQETEVEPPPLTIAEINGDPRPHLVRFEDFVRILPTLQKAAKGLGLVTFNADSDGIVRRVPAVALAGDQIVPTLAIEMLRVATGQPTLAIRSGEGGIESINLQGVQIPTDDKGQIWIHYAEPNPNLYVSAADILAGRVEAERVANRLVLIGTSATGLGDLKSTPLAVRMPGVGIHAELLETIYTADHLRRPSYAPGAERAFLVGVGLVLAIVGPIVPASLLPILLLGSALLALGVSWYAFAEHNMLIDGAYPTLSIAALILLLSLARYIREQAMQQSIRSAFGRYLSPVMVDQLASNPGQLKLTGETRELSIMFSDVRGFTTISESYANAPEELTSFMNRFLTNMTSEIMAHRGTVDKYIGDAIMAFWNAPLYVPNHAREACLAALGMTRSVRGLNDELKAEAEIRGAPFIPIVIGVGINSGECYVGNMGSEQRFAYSALGDTVNVAARIEGQSKVYGVDIVLGEPTRTGVPDLACLALDLVRLKGKMRPLWIFSLLGDEEVARSEAFVVLEEVHNAMLEAYRRQDWDAAAQYLEKARDCGGDVYGLNNMYQLYASRINDKRVNPPEPDWDGATVALSK